MSAREVRDGMRIDREIAIAMGAGPERRAGVPPQVTPVR